MVVGGKIGGEGRKGVCEKGEMEGRGREKGGMERRELRYVKYLAYIPAVI